MPNSRGFVDHVLELTGVSAPIEAKRMFGGHGLYDGPRMIGLIVDDVLYLRCGEADRPRYDALGLPAFQYAARGTTRTMPGYRRAPDDALENADAMREWLRIARQAALAAKPGAPPKPRTARRARKPR